MNIATMDSTTTKHNRQQLEPFYVVSLILIILLGTAERIYGIDRQSLWSDELFAVMASYTADTKQLWQLLINDSHPPGYVLFMYWTLPMSHYSDFEIRLHALFFGIYWMPLVFYICKRWISTDAGLLATALIASNFPAIYFSQEARAYSMLITFMLANLACFMEILFRNNSRKRFLYGFIITTVLSLYFHYSGFVFFSAEILLYALLLVSRQRQGSIKEIFLLFIVPILAYSPWFVVMVQQILDGHHEWAVSAPPTGNDVFMLLQRLLGPDYEHLQFYAVCLAISASLVFSSLWQRTLQTSHKVICCIFFLAAVPILAFYIKSLVSTPIFEKRYFLHVVPFMAIIAAYAINYVLQRLTNPFWHKPALVITIIAYSAWTINTNIDKNIYTELDKDPIREAARLVHNDVVRNNIPPDKYTTLVTFNWFEHYLRYYGIAFDLDWKYHVFYIPQQIGKVQSFLKDHKNLDYFYYLQFEQKGSTFAANALRQEYRLLSSAKLDTNSPFDISVFKFSTKEKPSPTELKKLGSDPTNDIAVDIAQSVKDKAPDAYTVLTTHDWMESYLLRNNVQVDTASPAHRFYGDWQLDDVLQYLDSHPAVDTIHYMALRENNALTAAAILGTKYKLTNKYSSETSAGIIDTYSFDTRQSPTDDEIRAMNFHEDSPVNKALSALSTSPAASDPTTYTFLYANRWLVSYLIRNKLNFDKGWKASHYYSELQTEDVLAYINQHTQLNTIFYAALRSTETERTALLLNLQYNLANRTTLETTAGKTDIYQFDTRNKPANLAELKKNLIGNPLNDIALWLTRDMAESGSKKSTVILSHEWFKTYLREYDVKLDGEIRNHVFTSPDQINDLATYLQQHPELEYVYYLALSEPALQPAKEALKNHLALSCKKTVDAPIGKLIAMRFSIRETPKAADAPIPNCKD